MALDPLVLIYILSTIVVILLAWIIRIEVKLRRLLSGKDGKTLEDSIVFNKKEIDKLKEFERDSMAYFTDIEKRLSRSIQSVETVRFNPFKGTGSGGDQSFSTSLINEAGNGLILSSLYSRDRIIVFAKPVKNFESSYELTDEEKDVVEKAKTNLK